MFTEWREASATKAAGTLNVADASGHTALHGAQRDTVAVSTVRTGVS